MSIAAALDELAARRQQDDRCTVGIYLDEQSEDDLRKIRQFLDAGGSRNDLFSALKKNGLGVKNVSSLNNHLSGRCGCTDVQEAYAA